MKFYEIFNFLVLLFLGLLFLFIFFLTVQIAFKMKLYRKVRRIFKSKVEFWGEEEALFIVKRRFLRTDNKVLRERK